MQFINVKTSLERQPFIIRPVIVRYLDSNSNSNIPPKQPTPHASLHAMYTRRRTHTRQTDPVHRRPQTPRRNTSRTPARASRRVRSPISRRRSPAANSTRARATGPRCPSAARGPRGERPSTPPLRSTAACRRWPRRAAAVTPAYKGSVLRTWARTSTLRTSTST